VLPAAEANLRPFASALVTAKLLNVTKNLIVAIRRILAEDIAALIEQRPISLNF
jgi:hypothetical protein